MINLPPLSTNYLWPRHSSGHTREVSELEVVHSGPEAASLLVALASQLQDGSISDASLPSDFSFATVLSGLQRLHNLDSNSPTFGCFRWYAEETQPNDTNAAFFIGLNLLALKLGYSDLLDVESDRILQEIFDPLDRWFDSAVSHRSAYYPNKYLGDLVCSWLLKEVLHREAGTELLETFRSSAEYWRDQHWGWGEHLSDVYAEILLNELSCLLLFAEQLPDDLRELCLGLFRELLAIEDTFSGGPRVPAIRNYDFTTVPVVGGFRSLIRPDAVVASMADPVTKLAHPRMFQFGSLFHALGWNDLAGTPAEPKQAANIPCFGDATATAAIDEDLRVGSLSRFPIMPQTNHAAWGLAWQSMPVAFCGANANWGLLRWMTEENDVLRYHPARDKKSAYLANALSETTTPPIIGHTQCHQQGHHLIALRTMPVLSRSWQQWGDGWDIVGFSGEVTHEESTDDGWSRLHLRLSGGREIALFFHGLGHGYVPSIEQSDGEFRWRVHLGAEALKAEVGLAHLWMVGEVSDPVPESRRAGGVQSGPLWQSWQLEWPPFTTPQTIRGAGGNLVMET